MQFFNDVYSDDMLPQEDITLKGILKGSLTIIGVHAEVTGIVTGNVIVKNGGSANINGMVNGYVVNDGGTLTVSGVVKKGVSTLSGSTVIVPGAITS